MAYRYDKQENSKTDLVFDGFEKGIASSPFKGIGNIRNLNIKYYDGVAYMNYKRQACTIQNSGGISSQTFTVTVASPAVFTSTGHGFVVNETVIFSTTGALPTGLTAGTVYYIISAGLTADAFQVSTSRGGAAVNTTGTQSGTHTFTVSIANPLYSAQSPAGLIYISDNNRNIWKQTAVSGSTFRHLTGNNANVDIDGLAFWNNYLFSLGGDSGGRIEICGTGAGDSTVTSSNWNNVQATNDFTVTLTDPAVFTIANNGLTTTSRVRLSSTATLPSGLSSSVDYYVYGGTGPAALTSTTFGLATGPASPAAVAATGPQSGTHTLTYDTGVWPIINGVTINLTTPAVAGDTGTTGFTYTDAGGTSRTFWNGPTGFYNLSFLLPAFGGAEQIVLANFTQGSDVITWTPALNGTPTGSTATLFYNSNAVTAADIAHPSLVAKQTGDLYFCNGSNIGSFTLNLNQKFNKNDMDTFTFYSNILALPATETSVALSELRGQLMVATDTNLYPWDFVSPFWATPVPMDEKFRKMINILNTLYILAGNKGNIYQSNGYSIDRFVKIPDYIAGVVDPSWEYGGVMTHRQKLYFQALAQNGQTGANILAGIFSVDLDTGAFNMENQNSTGLSPAGATSIGVLVDSNSLSIDYDKYYSAFSATSPKIDYNDTTLYSGNEAVIETDIAPVGTFLQNKTFGSAEFKLDQPLQSGDSITLYVRPSLSASWTLLGTTTTAVLAFAYTQMPIDKFQWLQFKATMSCNATATSSSFNRLRELRIR